MTRVAVVGAGGWGTALAVLMARNGHQVTLWARRPEAAERLLRTRENAAYLPGVTIPPNVDVTVDFTDVEPCPFVVLAVPSQTLRGIWQALAPRLGEGHLIINAAKGIELSSGLRLYEVLQQERAGVREDAIAVLSGPNHAEEVGLDLPTTSVVASPWSQTAEAWQELLMGPTFRVYTTHDVIGVELGGALKNVIALAAGICDGLGYGDNTKAALLTRGLAEMARLGVALGAHPLTFSGLSGMGDLIATCTSSHSRNTRAGRAIGQGRTLEEITAQSGMVIEGVPTCQAALRLAQQHGVEMPITHAVRDVVIGGKSPQEAVLELMQRGPKDELDAILSY